MTIPIADLQKELRGRLMPGGRIVIEHHEAAIAEGALRAEPDVDGAAHPAWFMIASLRCMGITVEELCSLARQEEGDTLLFGNCRIEQAETLRVGAAYVAAARIGEVGTRTIRDGSRLDSVEVAVELNEDAMDGSAGAVVGAITSVYLFKRKAA